MVNFCDECGHTLEIDTVSNELKFKCNNCGAIIVSNDPRDTEVSIYSASKVESGVKYGVQTYQAAFDSAAKRVDRPCKKCKMPYMVHIYIDESMESKYVCTCGHTE